MCRWIAGRWPPPGIAPCADAGAEDVKIGDGATAFFGDVGHVGSGEVAVAGQGSGVHCVFDDVFSALRTSQPFGQSLGADAQLGGATSEPASRIDRRATHHHQG